MSAQVHFIVNRDQVAVPAASGLPVLDYLRQQRNLTGTKEGCKEGDCGACMVLLGELESPGDSGKAKVRYQPMTSCLMPLAEVAGKHVVTIEGLDLGHANAWQQAIVDEGASQCGFCTPGIVVSMVGQCLQPAADRSRAGVRRALGGHLCRCTGYRSLIAAGEIMADLPSGCEALIEAGQLPAYFRQIPDRLAALPRWQASQAVNSAVDSELGPVIAGGTDLFVQQGEDLAAGTVRSLHLRTDELRGVHRQADCLRVGALTSFEDFAAHPDVQEQIPGIEVFMLQIASWQIRNRATLGGNIVNASPIGDVTVLLLAMGSSLVLSDGSSRRTLPMADFFLGYKQLAMDPREVVEEVLIPLHDDRQVDFEKVAKRKSLDIASVNSALSVERQGDVLSQVSIAVGGVAPIPLLLRRTAAVLTGEILTVERLQQALAVAGDEISPISDVRGSAEYKRLLVRQLLIAHFTKLFADRLQVEEFYATS